MTSSFAIFSLPGTSQFSLISGPVVPLSPDDIFQVEGFVFAPFDTTSEEIFCIEGTQEDFVLSEWEGFEMEFSSRTGEDTGLEEYQTMYQKALDRIASGSLEKIVISVRAIDRSPIRSVARFLEQLRLSYPTAFVYAFYIPGEEFWIGASPELLLESTNSVRRTVALAGTLQNGSEIGDWGEKEREEHRFVEQFVEEVLPPQGYRKSGPRPVKAGPVYHLKTDYFLSQEGAGVNPVDLHPGPALSGYPVPESIRQIIEIEQAPRRYYTGFLGPVFPTGECRLFINLRCLEILESGNMLYAGGGLTIDSDMEKEWKEIQDKLSTLRTKMEID